MNWTGFLLAVVLSGVAASFTDWLFMGLLFHGRYLRTPEIWRTQPGQKETRGIILSSLLGLFSSAVFLYYCVWAGIISSHPVSFHTALLFWLAAAVPIIFSNIVWIKMDPLLGISHSLGWLARFVLTAIIGNWLIH